MAIDIYDVEMGDLRELPFIEGGIIAGFPSPATDHTGATIDLNRELIKHPSTTFLARVVGDSMCEAEIYDGDIVVVDRSLSFRDGDVAICCVNGEFNIKYVEKNDEGLFLVPANKVYPKMKVDPEDDFVLWGVVTYVIHKPRRG